MMVGAAIDLSTTASATLTMLADATLKSSVLVVAAAAACVALRRASSATRHTVWCVALGVSLGLPLAVAMLPAVRVDVPLAPVAAASRPDSRVHVIATRSTEPAPMSVSSADSGPSPTSVPLVPWRLLVVGVWALGAALVLARSIVGWVRVRAIVRHSSRADDDDWTRSLERAASLLRLDRDEARKIRLVLSSRAVAPAAWGFRSTFVLLPEESRSWDPGRRDAVLLHELSHAKRRDCRTRLMADLACAVYWFNPLVWYASGAVRAEQERVADDCVLDAGVRPSDYATHLLDLACSVVRPSRREAAFFSAARESQLETRIRAILDPDRTRRPARSVIVAGAMLVLGIALAPLARSQPVVQTAQQGDRVPAASTSSSPATDQRASADVAVASRSLRESIPREQRSTDAVGSQNDRTDAAWPVPTPTPTPTPDPSFDVDASADDAAVDGTPAAGDTPVEAALKEALHDDDDGVRRQAAWALRMIRLGNGQLPDARVDAYPHPHPQPRPSIDAVPAPSVP